MTISNKKSNDNRSDLPSFVQECKWVSNPRIGFNFYSFSICRICQNSICILLYTMYTLVYPVYSCIPCILLYALLYITIWRNLPIDIRCDVRKLLELSNAPKAFSSLRQPIFPWPHRCFGRKNRQCFQWFLRLLVIFPHRNSNSSVSLQIKLRSWTRTHSRSHAFVSPSILPQWILRYE